MIVRITFLDKDLKPFTMLFGDSYKKWQREVDDYLHLQIRWIDTTTLDRREIFGVVKVEVSKSEWVSWGGLKWCSDENFQGILNREGCQDKDPDNPRPRQYNSMYFCEDKKASDYVNKEYKTRLRHLVD